MVERSYLDERDKQYLRAWKKLYRENTEAIYTVRACTGQLLSVPESRLGAFEKRNEELKQAMAEGWRPGTPLPEKYVSERARQHLKWYREIRTK